MNGVLTTVPARKVRSGDRVEGASLTVSTVHRGANRQVFLVCVTEGGAEVVVERDPGELVSVWR